MIRSAKLVVLIAALSWSTAAVSGPPDDANAVVERWAAAFNANDADAVVKLYANDAVVLGTVSPVISEGGAAIQNYFKALPGSGNKVEIGDHRTIVLAPDAVLVTGFYQFNPVRDGKPTPSPARFTIVVVKRGNEWLITPHHSSRRPEPPK
jgi:uncharacterized protein (TIGR02246 family)